VQYDFTFLGTSHQSWTKEILYREPDSWSVTYNGSALSDIILIDEVAWERRNGDWEEITTEQAWIIIDAFTLEMQALKQETDWENLGDGPVSHGEATIIKLASDDECFEGLVNSPSASDTIQKTYTGATCTTQWIEGKSSGRIFDIRLTVRGPNVQGEQSTSMDYRASVKIEPSEQ
jgi:hypothetical protein